MILSHYTSIDTLALILESKKIRFTRLDQLDDFYEVGIYNSHVPKHYYVSCWTRSETESVPQWAMYGANKRGVILKLDTNFIDLSPEGYPILLENNEYVIPNVVTKNEAFPVKYLEIEELKYQAKEVHQINDLGGINVYGNFGDIKSNHWEFQREYRMSVHIVKLDENAKKIEDLFPFIFLYDIITLH